MNRGFPPELKAARAAVGERRPAALAPFGQKRRRRPAGRAGDEIAAHGGRVRIERTQRAQTLHAAGSGVQLKIARPRRRPRRAHAGRTRGARFSRNAVKRCFASGSLCAIAAMSASVNKPACGDDSTIWGSAAMMA